MATSEVSGWWVGDTVNINKGDLDGLPFGLEGDDCRFADVPDPEDDDRGMEPPTVVEGK